jgi:hypothetical protein
MSYALPSTWTSLCRSTFGALLPDPLILAGDLREDDGFSRRRTVAGTGICRAGEDVEETTEPIHSAPIAICRAKATC